MVFRNLIKYLGNIRTLKGGALGRDDLRSISPLSLVHVRIWCLPMGKFHVLPWKNHADLQAKFFW